MSYTDHFRIAEDYIAHLDPVMGGIADPFIQSRYLGFIVISAVTVYELSIKEIFYDFSDKKHVVLGEFARAKFDQLNGRIKYGSLKAEHVSMFGSKYVSKFEKIVEKAEKQNLQSGNGSIKSSYGNIISWRHNFVHKGIAPNTTTYEEIKRSYLSGKEIIHCLHKAMTR